MRRIIGVHGWRAALTGRLVQNTVTDSEPTISSRPNQSKMILPVGNGSGRRCVFHILGYYGKR